MFQVPHGRVLEHERAHPIRHVRRPRWRVGRPPRERTRAGLLLNPRGQQFVPLVLPHATQRSSRRLSRSSQVKSGSEASAAARSPCKSRWIIPCGTTSTRAFARRSFRGTYFPPIMLFSLGARLAAAGGAMSRSNSRSNRANAIFDSDSMRTHGCNLQPPSRVGVVMPSFATMARAAWLRVPRFGGQRQQPDVVRLERPRLHDRPPPSTGCRSEVGRWLRGDTGWLEHWF